MNITLFELNLKMFNLFYFSTFHRNIFQKTALRKRELEEIGNYRFLFSDFVGNLKSFKIGKNYKAE